MPAQPDDHHEAAFSGAAAAPKPVGVAPGPSGSLSDALPLLLFLAAVVVALLAVRRLVAQRTEAGGPAMRVRPDSGGEAEPRERARADQMAAVTRDARELVQHLAAELDAKAERIEGLIREAERVIARLEGLQRIERVDGPADPAAVAIAEAKPAAADGGGPDPVTRRVYELADQGKTPVEIAMALGQQTGQVELILALRR